MSGVIGILRVDLHLPTAGSLKDKRRELRRIKAWMTQSHYAVAEVEHHDLWQRAGLVLATASATAGDVGQRLDDASRRIHADPVAVVVGEARQLHSAPDLTEVSLSHLVDG